LLVVQVPKVAEEEPLVATVTHLAGEGQDGRYNAYGELASFGADTAGTALFTRSVGRDSLGQIRLITEVIQGSNSTVGYWYDVCAGLQAEFQVATTWPPLQSPNASVPVRS
jgi:hypothetical protein